MRENSKGLLAIPVVHVIVCVYLVVRRQLARILASVLSRLTESKSET